MEIRYLKASDKVDWLPLWQGYLEFYQTSLDDTVTNNTWQNLINTENNIYGFGLWENSELVAIAHAVSYPSTWSLADYCYLNDLFVKEDYRNQGFARKLIEHIYEFAKTKNFSRVHWTTQENNYKARQLYDTLATKTDFIQYRKNI